jgi:hypothetical protein
MVQPRHHEDRPPPRRDNEQIDGDALLKENAELRELVIQLSKLVIKNIVDRR